MTANALKINIHELVNQTDDEDVLQGIYLLLKKLAAIENDFEDEIQAMGHEEFEAHIADRAKDTENEALLIDGETAISELRKSLKTPLRQQ